MSNRGRASGTVRPSGRRPWWCIAVAAVVVVTLAMAGPAFRRRPAEPAATTPGPGTVIATVNGQAIPLRQFALFVGQERAATFEFFRNTHGVGDSPHFWTTRYGGETPTDHVKRLALDGVVRATVQLQLAYEHGLLADPGYDAFVRAWNAENARRRAAVASGQAIYGPAQYTELNYFTYVLGQISAELAEKLVGEKEIRVDDSLPAQVKQADIQDTYDALIDRLVTAAAVQLDARYSAVAAS